MNGLDLLVAGVLVATGYVIGRVREGTRRGGTIDLQRQVALTPLVNPNSEHYDLVIDALETLWLQTTSVTREHIRRLLTALREWHDCDPDETCYPACPAYRRSYRTARRVGADR